MIKVYHNFQIFFCCVVVEKQRFFVDNLVLGVQLADVLTRCSHPHPHPFALRMTRVSSRNVGKLYTEY